MHRIKSLYITLFLTVLMLSLGIAIWQLTQGGGTGWWGVVIAAGAPMALFAGLTLAPRARTSASLWWIPAVGLGGTLLSLSIAGAGLVTGMALLNGVVLPLIYIHWYSRFEQRRQDMLAVGLSLPAELSLDDLDGHALDTAALTQQPALWIFFRGNWCPLCMAQVREIAAEYRSLKQRGVEVYLVSPQPQDHSRSLAKKFDAPMRFLVDRDNKAATRLGILAAGGLPMGMQALGYESDVPMPTVFITAAGGRIVYSDLTDNYRVRPVPATFIAALDRAGL